MVSKSRPDDDLIGIKDDDDKLVVVSFLYLLVLVGLALGDFMECDGIPS